MRAGELFRGDTRQHIIALVREWLAAGPVLAREMHGRAAAAGIARSTFQAAARVAGVVMPKTGPQAERLWSLPQQAPARVSEDLQNMGGNGAARATATLGARAGSSLHEATS